MRIAYAPEHERLRTELRGYFGELMTPERREGLQTEGGEYGDGTAYTEIVRQLGEDRWLALGWPREYGGRGGAMREQPIFTDEAALAGAPVPFLPIHTVGPPVTRCGPEQQRRDVPPRL